MKRCFAMKGGYIMRYIFVFIFHLHVLMSFGQQVDVIKSEQLFQMVENCEYKDKIQVYNFWATWCAPCIREIPLFETVNELNENVNVTLISLDDVDLLNKKVKPFILKKAIKSKVMLLDETDFNEIISRIDESWSGAIPATLIVDCRSGHRFFYEQEFTEDELKKTIDNLIDSP
ncbi:MAG: TlpA family protein disulfide reductase [Cyclobacteriaceae bacterium]|nr:TlpA family protein disulfide reductase [Cyclobacteriaceae bacterium]MCK5705530.1 TlpA family protein disulfide reductase [Cyclobacteriaceae bacterium]